MTGDFRFRPPRLSYSPELRWLLTRAFAPLEAPCPTPDDPDRALELAVSYRLAGRLGARVSGAVLARELGAGGARHLAMLHLAAVASARRLAATVDRLAGIARERRLPLAFLKFAAFHVSGTLRPGARTAVDVDVLVPRADAERFLDALVAAGFLRSGRPMLGVEQHLEPVRDPHNDVPVEVHTSLLGVNLNGRREFATFDRLAGGNQLVPLDGAGAGLFMPARRVQLAHLVVHGLAQHTGAAYPLTRMIGDLVDLCGGEEIRATVMAAHPLVAGDVAADEMAAVAGVAERLAAGDQGLLADGAAGLERRLLDHVVAAPVDRDYSLALSVTQASRSPSERSGVARLAKTATSVVEALFLVEREALEARFGGEASGPRLLLLRLLRPFELSARVTRAWLRRLRLPAKRV